MITNKTTQFEITLITSSKQFNFLSNYSTSQNIFRCSPSAVGLATLVCLLLWKWWVVYVCHQQHTSWIGAKRCLLPRSKWLWAKTERFNVNVSLER